VGLGFLGQKQVAYEGEKNMEQGSGYKLENLHEPSPCIICKEQCQEKCAACGESMSCLTRSVHNQTCEICGEKMCGTNIPGSVLTWQSKRRRRRMHMCMDCVFDGALYISGLMSFSATAANEVTPEK